MNAALHLVLLIMCCGFAKAGNDFKQPACGLPTDGSPRIVGGSDTQIEKYPWQVALVYCFPFHDGKCIVRCGGSLISPTWVITAAHCTFPIGVAITKVVVSITNKYNEEVNESLKYTVTDIFDSPSYCSDLDGEYADISLLKLEKPVDMENTNAGTVCLPDVDQNFTGEECVVTGWGTLDSNGDEYPEVLQSAKVTIGDWDTCSSMPSLGRHLDQRLHICAGNLTDGGVDTCGGDSGGPLACQQSDGHWVLAGITSYGIGCGWKDYPGIYTRVSTFLDWINDVINSKYDTINVLENDVVPPIEPNQAVNFTCRPRTLRSTDNGTYTDSSHLNSENDTDAENTSTSVRWYIKKQSYFDDYRTTEEIGYCNKTSGECILDNGARFPLWSIKYQIKKEMTELWCEDDHGILAAWNLTVIARPENMNCTIYHYGQRFAVGCSLLNVLPEDRMCMLTVYSEDSANYTSHYSRLYDTYYDECQRRFQCHFFFRDASSGLGPGRNVLNVTLYSESTQVTTHPLGYNVSTSLPDVIVSMPKPTFTDCPTNGRGRVNGSYVLLNSRYIACICDIEESSDYTPGDIFLSVTDGENTRNVSRWDHIIDTSSTEDQTYECYATSSHFPGRSPSVYKTIHFAYGPTNQSQVNLKRTDVTSAPYEYHKCSNSAIQMTCHVTGVVPEAALNISMSPSGNTGDVNCSSPGLCTYSFFPSSTGNHEFECMAWNAMFPGYYGPRIHSSVNVQVLEINQNIPLLIIDGNRYNGPRNEIKAALPSGQSVGISCYIEGASYRDIIISCGDVQVINGRFTPARSDDGQSCQCYIDYKGDCIKVTTEVTLRVKEDENGDKGDENNNNAVIIGAAAAGSVVVIMAIFAFFRFWRG